MPPISRAPTALWWIRQPPHDCQPSRRIHAAREGDPHRPRTQQRHSLCAPPTTPVPLPLSSSPIPFPRHLFFPPTRPTSLAKHLKTRQGSGCFKGAPLPFPSHRFFWCPCRRRRRRRRVFIIKIVQPCQPNPIAPRFPSHHALSRSVSSARSRSYPRGFFFLFLTDDGEENCSPGRISELAVDDVMWPLYFISDKLLKMPGDGGGGEGQLPRDGRIPLARRSHSIDVPHVQQAFNWDCGLACVLMVLRTLGLDCCHGIADLEKLCRTTSVWTVDLAYILNKFSVVFSFFTVTIGANPQYSAETFYREQLQEDIDRVDALFGKAFDAGISIQCRSISAYDIAFLLLSGHCIAIALVDKSKLNSSWMNDVQDVQQFDEDSEYMGHYVVICGYDADACEFEIRDPASSRQRDMVPMKSLDEARKSFGTDEDILLVSLTGKTG